MTKGFRKRKIDTKQKVKRDKQSRRRNHSIKRKYENKDKAPKMIKNIENMDKFLGPSISDLINSLDTPININLESKFKKMPEISFGSKINKREFYKYFQCGINYARCNYQQKSLKILKRILLMLITNQGDDAFGIVNNTNHLYQNFKIDTIISLLTNENKIIELKIKDIAKTDDVFKQTSEYMLLNNPDFFKNNVPYNKNIQGEYSIDKFEAILYSTVILNTYKELLLDLYDVHATTEMIRKNLKYFLKKHNIYFILMDLKKYGMILYDGTILINKIYTLSYSKAYAFIIFFTLLHELMHALSRLFIGDKNIFVCTDKFFKKNELKKVEESGDFFDEKILLDALTKHEITEYEAKYLLDSKNYNYKNADDFKLKFINFRKKHWGSIKKLPTFYIGKTSEIKTYSIKIRCNLGSARNIK